LSNFYNTYLQLCRDKKITPSKAALDVGISKTSVSRWKRGYIPTDINLQKLADYFGVSVDYFPKEEKKIDNETPKKEFKVVDFYTKLLDLCALNEDKDLSPSTVAEKIGVTRASATGWKKGAVPSDTNIQKIANLFGVPIEYFTEEEQTAPEERELSENEELFRIFSSLPEDQQKSIADLIRSLSKGL